ncbi:class I SAM-dependent methyltransferase [Catellatospora sp. NPDC049133]|jgi:2-polyprenyl-3-methyl-5-hydroxy-6-metoxy-1,4-benzoquinol methylase|uniref:class I SAM-dependent methyltransferase n=1 Tax=Catellatospora sp. NPDC049133 TaxID=3155499 RepID=UPI00340E7F3F
MAQQTRWATETERGHAQRMADRFRQMAAEGHDLAGEARTLDAIIAPGSAVLDAGCGSGRVGAALAVRGHTVLGVDADETLIAAAREDFPEIEWLVGDLTELDLTAGGQRRLFDAAILAGNVMLYLAPDTETEVLRRVGGHVRPGGPVVVGFGTGRGYAVADFDAHAAQAGLLVEQRFATWDLRPWREDADFAVTVLRRPAG